MFILVTGGSGSGKSEYAEALVQRLLEEIRTGSLRRGETRIRRRSLVSRHNDPLRCGDGKKDRPSPKDAERQRFCDKRMLSGSERICARGRKERKQTIRRSAGMYVESDSQ